MKLKILLLIGLFLTSIPVHACTTFCIYNPNAHVFGKNYDWRLGDGLIFINPRNQIKFGTSRKNTPSWTSTYGSITFNQYGLSWPSGGMNEVGLTIELSWLDETEYKPHEGDERLRLGTLSWIQYQLDTSATVEDVLASDRTVKISPGSGAKVHYLVCDRTGACVTFEYIDRELVAHKGRTLPWAVLTNNTYEDSVNYAKEHETLGGLQKARNGNSSLDRFVRAAQKVQHYQNEAISDTVESAFNILEDVKQGTHTKWQIVYDIRARRVHFRTLKNSQKRTVSLSQIDFSCASGVRYQDIDAGGAAEIEWLAYSRNANSHLIHRSYKGTPFLAGVPENILESLANFPDQFECAD